MKKILSICALAMFLGAGIIGCSGSSTSGTPISPPSGSGKMPTPPADGKAKPDPKEKM